MKIEETRQKMSEARKGRFGGENAYWFGKHLTEETRRKLSEANKGRFDGEKNPMFGIHLIGEKNHFCGKHHLEKSRQKMSEARKGRFGGEKSPTWKGGISFEPYCPKFNKDFKERVRILFDRKCFECNMSEEENGKKLSVHHVNYDKMMCCDDTPPLFVPLCQSCHTKTNNNRVEWEAHFIEKLMAEKNGKCYFTKDEVENSLLRWKIL